MRKHKSSNFNKFVFIALFGAMALTAFRLVSKPTNLLQGVLAPLPQASLLVGSSSNSQNDEPGDEAKFFAIERTANGVDLVLHRPEDVSSDMLEVTLVGSTNLVTATWSPFMNVTFPEGETNVSATVTGAMLDAHSVSNMCFFAFINAGDSDADGLADWDERFNLKTDPYSTDSDGDDLDDVLDPEPAVFDPFSRAHWTLWDDSTVFAGGSDVGVVFETTVPVRRRSLWRQYFLSGSQDGAAAWALDGHQLEWRCSADAPWTVLVPPAGDSLRLQLPADAEWVAFRLRLSADGAPPVRPPPLHLLTYRPHVSVEAEIVEEEDGLRRVLAVFTDGDESLVPISVDRSGVHARRRSTWRRPMSRRCWRTTANAPASKFPTADSATSASVPPTSASTPAPTPIPSTAVPAPIPILAPTPVPAPSTRAPIGLRAGDAIPGPVRRIPATVHGDGASSCSTRPWSSVPTPVQTRRASSGTPGPARTRPPSTGRSTRRACAGRGVRTRAAARSTSRPPSTALRRGSSRLP